MHMLWCERGSYAVVRVCAVCSGRGVFTCGRGGGGGVGRGNCFQLCYRNRNRTPAETQSQLFEPYDTSIRYGD